MSDYGNNAEVGGNLTVTGSSTFNQDSADVNFIVETDDSDRTLWVDGANNNVGVGCAPSGSGNTTLLSVSGSTKIGETLYVDTVSSLSDTDTYITLGAEGNHIKFYVNGAEYMNISSGDGVEIAQYGGHLGDTDTYFNFSSDKLELVCGAKSMQTWVEAAQDQIIVNEDGNDIDFRVGSLNEPNMLFVEGSTDRVGIGIGAPSGTLHIAGPGASDTSVIIESLGDSSLWVVADTDDVTESQNPSIYMSQETAVDNAYQFHMGIEGAADQTYTGSFSNQPFILSRKQDSEPMSVRTFQIATDDAGDISSRLSIGTGGKVIVGDKVQSADARLHVKDTVGDLFKLENTTAYGVTYGQLVKADLTIATAGASPIDTTLDLPAGAILDTLIVKLTTVGVVSSGTDYQLTNITLDNGITPETMFSAFLGDFSLIGDGSSIVSGTMYYFNNIHVLPPAGGVGYLWTAGTQDIKLNFSDANVTTDAIMDVAVYYRKFDLVR